MVQGRRKKRRSTTNTEPKSSIKNFFDRFPDPSLRRIKEKVAQLGKVAQTDCSIWNIAIDH